MIGLNLERPQHLVEHRAMLGGDARKHLETAGQVSKVPDQDAQLDCFRAGTEHDQHSKGVSRLSWKWRTAFRR